METATDTAANPLLVQPATNMSEQYYRRHLIARHGGARISREEHDSGHARHPDARHEHEQEAELIFTQSIDDIEINMEPFAGWQYMDCPECGARTIPYGGFGEGVWEPIGKYSCKQHRRSVAWYANPITGQHYDRKSRGGLQKVEYKR